MRNRFVSAFVIFLIVIGIIVTCVDYVKTTTNSNEMEAGTAAVSSVTPETTTKPTETPEATTKPTETPEATTKPTETPETTTKPTETPEATTKPTETPEATTKPTETPEATTKPTETPEATTKPTETPEATTKPTETPEATTQPTETPEATEPAGITFESEYISEEGYMPYALFTPSSVNESEKTPLIVWLHGSGEVGVGEKTFFNSGLLKVMSKWRRQGFNAYVICPQLAGNYNTGRWNKESTRDNLQALLDKFIEEHNIDLDRIIVVGHSLGGQGALYMAHQLPQYFSRCVVLSGYNPGIDISEIKVPTIGFVGTANAGEDTGSISYMKQYFMEEFGDESTFFFETSHGGIPSAVFSFDTDDDDKSDLIEWMLGEFEF